MVGFIVDKHQCLIPQTAIAIAFKLQRHLYWRIAKHTSYTIERLSVFMQPSQEEVGMVESRKCESWQGVLHVNTEVPTIFLLNTLGRL